MYRSPTEERRWRPASEGGPYKYAQDSSGSHGLGWAASVPERMDASSSSGRGLSTEAAQCHALATFFAGIPAIGIKCSPRFQIRCFL